MNLAGEGETVAPVRRRVLGMGVLALVVGAADAGPAAGSALPVGADRSRVTARIAWTGCGARLLVGDRALTYRAVSYGTFLGQTYAGLFPRRVRAMALDGLVDPRIVMQGAEARFANTVVAMDRGLGWFASRCGAAGPARCALAGAGQVGARVQRLLARLRRGPIPAPAAQPPGALRYGEILTALFANLTNPAAWPQLADGLDRAAEGDGSALATPARAVLAGVRSAAGDPTPAITCTDSPARHGPQARPEVIRRLTRASAIGRS